MDSAVDKREPDLIAGARREALAGKNAGGWSGSDRRGGPGAGSE
jgi:hypothetical protein